MDTGRMILCLVVLALLPGTGVHAQERAVVVQGGGGLHGYIGYRGSKPPEGGDYGAGAGPEQEAETTLRGVKDLRQLRRDHQDGSRGENRARCGSQGGRE